MIKNQRSLKKCATDKYSQMPEDTFAHKLFTNDKRNELQLHSLVSCIFNLLLISIENNYKKKHKDLKKKIGRLRSTCNFFPVFCLFYEQR
jgi:GR25 family glycosyltransferase involved in LPS biosynthesis